MPYACLASPYLPMRLPLAFPAGLHVLPFLLHAWAIYSMQMSVSRGNILGNWQLLFGPYFDSFELFKTPHVAPPLGNWGLIFFLRFFNLIAAIHWLECSGKISLHFSLIFLLILLLKFIKNPITILKILFNSK